MTSESIEPELSKDLYIVHQTRVLNMRRGRESNPRIAVLQTATLPLGYPANVRADNINGAALVSSADGR